VSGLTIVSNRRQSSSRDNATSAIRVASSARRGFACRSMYSANCFLRKRFSAASAARQSAHCRDESWQVAHHAQESRHAEAMTSADHVGKMIRNLR
jgi:hypothetical protein